MDRTTKKTNLLIIRGVFPKDFTSGTVQKIKPQFDDRKIIPVYTVIPKRFTGVAKWPTSSNLKCWTCDRLFSGYPRFLPSNPERTATGDDYCDAEGNFHSWNCVASWIESKLPRAQQWDANRLICLFESKFTGRMREKILPSTDKTKRKEYCGDHGLTMEQYDASIDKLNNEYDLTTYKMDHFKTSD